MFEAIFSIPSLIVLGVGLTAGAFIGIGLGRRSKSANKVYDDAQARYERERDNLRNK